MGGGWMMERVSEGMRGVQKREPDPLGCRGREG